MGSSEDDLRLESTKVLLGVIEQLCKHLRTTTIVVLVASAAALLTTLKLKPATDSFLRERSAQYYSVVDSAYLRMADLLSSGAKPDSPQVHREAVAVVTGVKSTTTPFMGPGRLMIGSMRGHLASGPKESPDRIRVHAPPPVPCLGGEDCSLVPIDGGPGQDMAVVTVLGSQSYLPWILWSQVAAQEHPVTVDQWQALIGKYYPDHGAPDFSAPPNGTTIDRARLLLALGKVEEKARRPLMLDAPRVALPVIGAEVGGRVFLLACPWVLVVLQGYLLLHLIQLGGRLRVLESGCKANLAPFLFPWLGLWARDSQSRLGRAAILFPIILPAPLTVGLLTWAGAGWASARGDWLPVCSPSLAFILCVVPFFFSSIRGSLGLTGSQATPPASPS